MGSTIAKGPEFEKVSSCARFSTPVPFRGHIIDTDLGDHRRRTRRDCACACARQHADPASSCSKAAAEAIRTARRRRSMRAAKRATHYLPLESSRLRYLGGSSNHWGGWCRPLDAIDFEARDWLPHSGWPFARTRSKPYFAACAVDRAKRVHSSTTSRRNGRGARGADPARRRRRLHDLFAVQQDSATASCRRISASATASDLKQIPNLSRHAPCQCDGIAAGIECREPRPSRRGDTGRQSFHDETEISPCSRSAEWKTPRCCSLRNDVMPAGVGNGHDLVGRFFADHPIPGDTATMVLFNGAHRVLLPAAAGGEWRVFSRGAHAPRRVQEQTQRACARSTTIEGEVQLDGLGQAAVAAAAGALGVDAGNMRAFTLGCGMELAPDPDRRLTLTSERDALGMPRLNARHAHFRRGLPALSRHADGIGPAIARRAHRHDPHQSQIAR